MSSLGWKEAPAQNPKIFSGDQTSLAENNLPATKT
jgi:hypothetical protein